WRWTHERLRRAPSVRLNKHIKNNKIQPNRPSFFQVTPSCAFFDFGDMCAFQQRSNRFIQISQD
ncbi:hypothetical protein BpHYR1_017829, partial [Brachionus plicatilis]